MKIEIKNRWTGNIIFTVEAGSMKLAVKAAIEQKIILSDADLSDAVLRGAVLRGAVLRGAVLRDADLRGAVLRGAVLRGAVLRGAVLSDADLRGADLRGADLSDAVLRGAVLRDADLRGAVLRGAVLRGAVLRGAVLSDADLSDADLRGADLSDAVLRGAVLRGAVLRGAVLSDADLSDAVLTPIRDDFWNVLLMAPIEIAALRQALVDGKVDGSTYSGECACLVGTIANTRKCNVESLGALKPNSSRPAERFFLGIKPGGTPEKNQFAKIAVGWIDEFVAIQTNAAKVFGK